MINDPNIMTSAPKKHDKWPKKCVSIKKKFTGSTGIFGENRDIKTFIKEPFANNLALCWMSELSLLSHCFSLLLCDPMKKWRWITFNYCQCHINLTDGQKDLSLNFCLQPNSAINKCWTNRNIAGISRKRRPSSAWWAKYNTYCIIF